MTAMNQYRAPGATPENIRDLWESDLDREIADAAIDESGDNAQLLRALRSAPIPIIDTPVDETWVWSDLHLPTAPSCSPGTGRSARSSR